MSLIDPIERLLANLDGEISPEYIFIYIRPDVALAELKQRTGQDFGYDSRRWREWLKDNGFQWKESWYE